MVDRFFTSSYALILNVKGSVGFNPIFGSVNNLLLLHGALGSAEQLRGLKQDLGSKYEVYSLNFSGHGGRQNEKPFSINAFTGDVLEFMDSMKLNRTDIFGYSMGGYVALNLALMHPERVGKIVTYGTKFDWTPDSAANEVKMLDPEKIESKVPQFADYLKKIHAPLNWKAVLSNTAEMMIGLGNNPNLNPESLRAIKNPVLIGLGEKDNMVSRGESQKAHESLANGKLRLLEGFVHPIEKNDLKVLAGCIDEFLRT